MGRSLPEARRAQPQLRRLGREQACLCLSALFRPSVDWAMLFHTGDGSLLHSACQFTNLIWKRPHRHTRK